MSTDNLFAHKLIDKLDKIDGDTLKAYLKQLNEEKSLYLEILNLAEESVLLFDCANRKFTYTNDQAKKMLNKASIASLEDIEDDAFRSLIDSQITGKTDKDVRDIEVLLPREMVLRCKFLTLSLSGSHPHFLVIAQNLLDISTSQAWEQKINRIEGLVKLAAGIAHEIGNPLNSIGIHLQLLKKNLSGLKKEQRSDLENTVDVIQNETRRLDSIISNFLKAVRKPPLRFKHANLNELISEALLFFDPQLQGQKIRADFIHDEELPEFMMDTERLHQVFINLIKNAMEAMPKGGEITVNVEHTAKLAKVTFSDTGIGISDEDLPHIFDAYFTTNKHEGHGLGLMTVLESIKDHGGRIEVKSHRGAGAAFTIILPIRQPKLQIPTLDSKITKEP